MTDPFIHQVEKIIDGLWRSCERAEDVPTDRDIARALAAAGLLHPHDPRCSTQRIDESPRWCDCTTLAVIDAGVLVTARAVKAEFERDDARARAAWEKDLRKQSDGVIADLEGDLAEAEAALTRVRDLHHIVETCGNPQHTNPSFTCPDCDAVCSCGGAWICETAHAVDGDDV